MTLSNTTHIAFLLFDGFPLACLTSLIEPLRVANEISDETVFSWTLISEGGQSVQSSAMIAIDVKEPLSHLTDVDYLVLLSPPKATFEKEDTVGILRHLSRHGTVLGAISGGVFPLARTGLVSDQPLAVHWCYQAAFDNEFPTYHASEQVTEHHQGFITAAGAAGGFEVALALIEERLSQAMSTEVACWFQHPMMRKSGIQQITPVLQETVTKQTMPQLVTSAINIMQDSLDEPLTIEEIASRLCVTSRHLERVFKASTSQSPSHYYRMMRVKAARQLVFYTNETITTIAERFGYNQSRAFRRHYASCFGVTPEDDRKQINLYRVEGNISLPSLWAKD